MSNLLNIEIIMYSNYCDLFPKLKITTVVSNNDMVSRIKYILSN